MSLMNYEGGRAKHNYPVSFLTSQEQLSAICSTSQICPFLSTRALAPWIMASLFRSPPWQQFPKWFPRCLSGLLKFTFHTVTKVIFPKSESGSDTIPFLKSSVAFCWPKRKDSLNSPVWHLGHFMTSPMIFSSLSPILGTQNPLILKHYQFPERAILFLPWSLCICYFFCQDTSSLSFLCCVNM